MRSRFEHPDNMASSDVLIFRKLETSEMRTFWWSWTTVECAPADNHGLNLTGFVTVMNNCSKTLSNEGGQGSQSSLWLPLVHLYTHRQCSTSRQRHVRLFDSVHKCTHISFAKGDRDYRIGSTALVVSFPRKQATVLWISQCLRWQFKNEFVGDRQS